jgi:hypothetical protein
MNLNTIPYQGKANKFLLARMLWEKKSWGWGKGGDEPVFTFVVKFCICVTSDPHHRHS